MKTKNVTFSLPVEVVEMMQSLIGKQSMSQFAAKVLAQALEEKKEFLRMAYIKSNNDKDRQVTINDWSVLDKESWDE